MTTVDTAPQRCAWRAPSQNGTENYFDLIYTVERLSFLLVRRQILCRKFAAALRVASLLNGPATTGQRYDGHSGDADRRRVAGTGVGRRLISPLESLT